MTGTSAPLSPPGLRWQAHYVTDPAHGVNEPGLATLLGFSPEVTDVHLQAVGIETEVVPPHPVENNLAWQHLSRVAKEQLEQQELGARQLDRPLPSAHLARARVEGEVAEAEDLVVST